MDGPAHYREAERLLDTVKKVPAGSVDTIGVLTRAHVHATLALAAAQIEDMEPDVLRPGWAEIVDEEVQ